MAETAKMANFAKTAKIPKTANTDKMGSWVGWLERSEQGPRRTKFFFTLSYPKLHFPTNFHQNPTKIAKVFYQGGFRGVW